MPAKIADLKIEQGKNFKLVATVREAGAVKNLAGFAGRMQVRPEPGSVELLADLGSTEITIPTPVNGQVVVNIPATTTSTYIWSNGQYDLEVFNSTSGEVVGVLKGYISCEKQVTIP